MKKSSRVYIIILGLWAVTVSLAAPAMYEQVEVAVDHHWYIGLLAAASAVFIAYFWLNGVKDIVYTLYYHLVYRRRTSEVPRRAELGEAPRVVLVYCTCNDFSPESLRLSMRQRYPNFETVILDDSRDPRYLAEIDYFAAEHGIRVIRRPDRTGFKAGNLNNFLRSAEFDYFVILDSDEIIPPDYISRSLDYFAHYDNAGIVQANHVATRNRNPFMRLFSIGVDSHWIAYQTVKDRHGFLSLLGHGAMVSRECYRAAGGFPHVVAEDLCFSIAARDAGYFTVFAPDIECEEEFPVNYFAFKKRHSKWTQGNMEFIKKYTGTIRRSAMTWFEKLDIYLFTYSLPLTALFSLYVAIHVVILPVLHHSVIYPFWMLWPTIAFLLAPMLNDVIFHFPRMRKTALLSYLVHTILLYGSMYFISLRSSITSAFGRSTFIVTPKEDQHTTLRNALHTNKGEIAFGICLAVTAMWLDGSVLPVVLLAVPSVLCFYLALKHNLRPAGTAPRASLSHAAGPAERGVMEAPVGVGALHYGHDVEADQALPVAHR